MTSFEKEPLQSGLCDSCTCKAFAPKIDYVLDVEEKTIKVHAYGTVFDAGDSLEKAHVRVYDKNGTKKYADLPDVTDTGVTIDISTLDLTCISVTVTIISKNGCVKELGIYNIDPVNTPPVEIEDDGGGDGGGGGGGAE